MSATSGYDFKCFDYGRWAYANGKNEPYQRYIVREPLQAAIAAQWDKLASLKSKGGSKKDKRQCLDKIRHYRRQLEKRSAPHSMIGKREHQRAHW